MSLRWTIIDDDNVRTVWQCQDGDCECKDKNDQGETTKLDPASHRDIGIPICSEGLDMESLYTEIAT